jgi:tetratricopeptide (TPR) repeat protein
MGEHNLLSTTAGLLARTSFEQGRFEDALRYGARSEQTSAPEDAWSQAIWRGVKARLLARMGNGEEARTLAEAAVAIIERTDQLSSHGDSLADLADVLARSGDTEAARRAAQAAIACYERKGNEVSAARLRELVDTEPPC